VSRMLRPKAQGHCWFGDQLHSRSSSLSWHLLRPRSSLWCERLSWLLSMLSARRRASMVFRTLRLGPRRLLTADAAAPTGASLVAPLLLRAAPSTADAHATPWRLRAPGSRTAAWPRRLGSGTPVGREAVHQRQHLRLYWRVDCCGLRHAHDRRRCATARLVCSRSAFTLVAIPLMGLALHRNVLRRASIAVPLTGLALHRHALCKLSLAWLGVHAKLLV
jgi:hypothetical protein